MRLTLSLILFAACLPASAQTWNLVWSDEFNNVKGSLPDASTWAYDSPTAGASNQEYETYCGQAGSGQTGVCSNWTQNAIEDGQGNLVISAVKDSSGNWTSARLLTSSTYTFTYGRAEARIWLPYGAGIWPAFWMLGSNIFTIGWPDCGEADMMENVPQLTDASIQSSLNGPGYNGATSVYGTYHFPSGSQINTGYHVYGVLWSQGQIQYYVDDYTHPFVTLTPADLPSDGTWAYDGHPFFMLLNLAIGGDWPGPPNATTPNPVNMLIDYVRVYQTAPVAKNTFASDSAASYNQNLVVSPDSIASGFGSGWSTNAPAVATTSPLPGILNDTQVLMQDSTGNTFPAPLYIVTAGQINYEVPAGLANGPATVYVTNGGNVVASGTVQIAAVAPGLFAANATGSGPAAAQFLTTAAGGAQTYSLAATYNSALQSFELEPVNVSTPGSSVYLILYGTGIRNASSLAAVQATVDGVSVPVQFAGAQPDYAGEDQINVGPLPASLAGSGTVNVALSVNGSASNTVQIAIQ
jgi:uncharacterized protein (TIGR03437 family)